MLDDALFAQAQCLAHALGTTIEELIYRGLRRELAQGQTQAGGAYETLVDYSFGIIPRRAAMKKLGLTDYAQLLHSLAAAGLPRPKANKALMEQGTNQFVAMLGEASPDMPSGHSVDQGQPAARDR